MTDSQKLDYLIEQMTGVKAEITEMKEDIAGLKEDVAGLKEDVAGLQERMDKQENELRYIRTFQENNLEKGIKIIAEGHVMLLRRLNEALKITEDDEMLRLRVNVLECDMSRVKEKLAVG